MLVTGEVVGQCGRCVAADPPEELILDAFEAILGVEGHVERSISPDQVLPQEMGHFEDL